MALVAASSHTLGQSASSGQPFEAVMIRNSVPVRYPRVATTALLSPNVVIFLFQVWLPPREQAALIHLYGLVPARHTDPTWSYQVGLSSSNYVLFISSMFLHGGWMHLILNMWTLWLFGGYRRCASARSRRLKKCVGRGSSCWCTARKR
jgi:membrane associated rhomboid family serine protease